VNYGLAPRPTLAPDEMAALVAAAEVLLKEERRRVKDKPPAWRFSGRWFNSGPYALRRPHHVN
jgi:hypothetical protein